ncbi:MAG: aminodeoxychorismate/anthranilate synthase component II [Candidatus Eisenbacteria bacterium]|uniref:Aminodeoxychorismate/anthranilate synthase component II n=1 Tax=Eiseniibacteriota bacterium TaxID=2212470 RepID=A0A956N9J8_UNCEI|nr:aminodeoxychorismate/anthranilate synthase component II [Candidatus Eisenbacteria bacterium]MCB9462626.1 aminodeoxychorismate/anthranilate synthase component II [Candidatus Eisenbacteria bacterium]
MILVIDNYDSFTYNLVQYLGELGAEVETHRNDEIDLAAIAELAPKGILVSPGPKRPEDTEPSNAILREFAGKIPIFGVCLGHQCMAHVYGAKVVRAERLMHGKTSPILHDGRGVFHGLSSPFEATRYHSLLVDPDTVPSELEVTAWTPEGEIMGLQHKEHPLWGVQFHPESILTAEGKQILANFLRLVGEVA